MTTVRPRPTTYRGKRRRALERMEKLNSLDATPEPCSSCGRDGVTWSRVREVRTDQIGWRWRCAFCKASRFIPVTDGD